MIFGFLMMQLCSKCEDFFSAIINISHACECLSGLDCRSLWVCGGGGMALLGEESQLVLKSRGVCIGSADLGVTSPGER